MRIISFAWTTPALLAIRKTVTRRDWNHDYAKLFKAGMRVQAYDRSPRHGGQQIAVIEIRQVGWELDLHAPTFDYEAEGFSYLSDHPCLLPKTGPFSDPDNVSWETFDDWRSSSSRGQYVIRFGIVSLTRYGDELKEKYEAEIAKRESQPLQHALEIT